VVVRSLNVIFGGISMIHTFEQTIHTSILVGLVCLAVFIISVVVSWLMSRSEEKYE